MNLDEWNYVRVTMQIQALEKAEAERRKKEKRTKEHRRKAS
jgi:DNA replication protein DnaC